MFTVKIVGDTRGILPKHSNFQIRHLRERERSGDRVVNATHGGYTVMVCQDNSRIFISRCHENDQFNRRVGILTCLQKYVGDVFIEDYKFKEDGIILYLDVDQKAYPTWIKGAHTIKHFFKEVVTAQKKYEKAHPGEWDDHCAVDDCDECDPPMPEDRKSL